jgi:mono/diheme cytochrome c family protein
MSCRSAIVICGLLLALPAAPVAAQQKVSPTRGELLYTVHCVECHNARVHWRDQRLATDWTTLRAQVRRWQGVQKLKWSEADITEVARYLNTYYYEFPVPEKTSRAPLRESGR